MRFATDIKEVILLEFAFAGGVDSLFQQGLNCACGVFLEFSQHIFSMIMPHVTKKAGVAQVLYFTWRKPLVSLEDWVKSGIPD